MTAFHAREQVGDYLRLLDWEQIGDGQILVSEYRSYSKQGTVRLTSKGPVALRYQPDHELDLPSAELIDAILERRSLPSMEQALKLAGLSPQAQRQSD